MSENNLFQFAQVIAELPIQNTTPNNSTQHHTQQQHSSYQQQQQQQHDPQGIRASHQYLHIRKNACVVCSICFTCSKYYGIDCTCQEIQPRRGKNLPEGGLDSRAKKLHRGGDQDDYEFSITWINENANDMYKDEHDQVVGLRELSEVSLCKAHSSTLYRAKKRHERLQQLQSSSSYLVNSGGLAAKVRELSSSSSSPSSFVAGSVYQQQQQQQQQSRMMEMPDFSRLSHSTSNKRKRTSRLSSPTQIKQEELYRPNSSMSTPLLYSSTSFSRPTSSSNSSSFIQQPQQQELNQVIHPQQQQQQQQQQLVDNTNSFPSSSQLPPLHSRQQHVIYPTLSHSMTTTTTIPRTPIPTKPIPTRSALVIETVSLKSSTDSNYYYFRNLAITDSFTFRDLLQEIDMTGTPPPGKRIVISDNDVFYPLDQPIRSVIKRPVSTHLDLSLGLTDKPLINWSHYS